MFITSIRTYISIHLESLDKSLLLPSFDWRFGESTHFYHPFKDGKKEVPLNKEWGVSFTWLWLHADITFNKSLRENLNDVEEETGDS